MSIEITIVRSPKHINNAKLCHAFAAQGGTLGRGPENAWVLEDPERFISSRHSQISYENGQYYLADLSTNGTFYNGAAEPIGNGNRVALKDGDRFSLGDYEFQVRYRDESPVAGDDPFALGAFAGMAAPADNFDSGFAGNDPFASPLSDGLPSFEPLLSPGYEETDPLAALDKAGRSSQANPFLEPYAGSQADNADPMQQAVAWPSAIPEDWDDDGANSNFSQQAPPMAPAQHVPAASSVDALALLDAAEQQLAALEDENRKLLSEVMRLKQQLKNATTGKTQTKSVVRKITEMDEALIDAMGLAGWNLSEKKKLEISTTVGKLMRETLLGLMQALSFRKKIKEEFRINVTTIQPVENNPLKFSANLEDAVENMFIRENKAYMRPLDAVREGFQGISEHQVAVLAGIQAAFRGMIERFDPESLEKRFEKYRKAGVIKVGQKSKNWDSYKEFHQDLVNNMDNSFQHLFGYDFMQAYEDQLQRLLMSRRARDKAKS